MKPIEELNISPWPWFVGDKFPYGEDNEIYCHYTRDDGKKSTRVVAQCNQYFDVRAADAQLIANAPEMYEVLREAIIDKCHLCESCSGHPNYKCENKESQCYVKKWHAVLAEAAGEEVSKCQEKQL